MNCFCPMCKKETRHRSLKPTGFFTQVLISAITGFGVSHMEPTHQCNACGHKHDPA